MDIGSVARGLRPAVRRTSRLSTALLRRTATRRLARVVFTRMPTGANLTDITVIRHDDGRARVRVLIPRERRSDAAVLWIHGGGMLLGCARMDDRIGAATARTHGIPVVSVEYRPAPEHPFPAPLDDCRAAWEWLQRNASGLDVDPARVVLGGHSAGGCLAAALAQSLHDTGARRPLAQWLWSPMLDDRTAARHELDRIGHFGWDNHNNRYAWSAYLGLEPGAVVVPDYAVPARRDDLTGLPPAWIGISDIDLFFPEARRYARRLEAAGVDTTLEVVSGAPHGFEGLVPDHALTRLHQAAGQRWLHAILTAEDHECRNPF